MLTGLFNSIYFVKQNTGNITISRLSEFSSHMPQDEVAKSIFVVSLKPGVKILHSSGCFNVKNDGKNRVGMSGYRIREYIVKHPDYKNLAIENANGKMECISFPAISESDTLAIFISDLENPSVINRNENVVFAGAILKGGDINSPCHDDFIRRALAYVNHYFPVSYERLDADKKKKYAAEQVILDEKNAKEERARKYEFEKSEKIRLKEEAAREEREKQLVKSAREKIEKETLDTERIEADRLKHLAEQERLYLVKTAADTEALRVRLELENKALEERTRIETQALQVRLQMKTEALAEESRLTLEMLEMRERMERQDTEGTSKTVAQLLDVLKQGRTKWTIGKIRSIQR